MINIAAEEVRKLKVEVEEKKDELDVEKERIVDEFEVCRQRAEKQKSARVRLAHTNQ